MKVKISDVLAVCFILGLLPLAANGQEPEKRYQLYLVVDELVKPSMQQEYYEAAKNWVAFMKDHEFPYPFNAFWTGDNHVYWSMPIQSYADIDKMMEASNKMMEKSPDDFKALQDAFKGTHETTRLCVYALDYKYSMIAEEEEGESEEENFVFFDIYYFEPGHDAEIDKIFQEFEAFMADKEIIQSWYAYWGMMGTDNPVLVSAATAKNARAFYEENAKAWSALGKEAGKIKQKMMKYVTKQEQKTAWAQKELSYTPAKKEE
ncbi:MAG: hypothetical protein JSV17_04590 [Candidatus Aminicenantes bacterium]|nr:MAG: hypothetical protein JSV17_04590 [Candidatus Aminicenantes bacterium]